MRRFITVLSVLALLTITLPVGATADAPEPSTGDVRAWLEALALDAGVADFDVDALEVERRSVDAHGVVTTRTLTGEDALAYLASSHAAGFVGVDVPRSGPVPQDGVVGALMHLMLQFGSCPGYDVREVAPGVTRVRGSWDFGMHASLPASATAAGLAGGDVIVPGVDLASDPGALLAAPTAHLDTSTWGVGQLTSLTEDRLTFFGFCLALIGSFTATGGFLFDGVAPDVPQEPALPAAPLTAR